MAKAKASKSTSKAAGAGYDYYAAKQYAIGGKPVDPEEDPRTSRNIKKISDKELFSWTDRYDEAANLGFSKKQVDNEIKRRRGLRAVSDGVQERSSQ